MIKIELMQAAGGDALACEIVERKGLGHPDSICDALAENLSVTLARHYIERFGRIMHHNVDKALLWGGTSKPAYGRGEIAKPMTIYLAGRATSEFRGASVPIGDIVVDATRRWFKEHLPTVDAERHIETHCLIRPGSADLVELFERNQRENILLSNDTSIGVGFAPFSRLETAVDRIERTLNSRATKTTQPMVGPDIKVMGVRTGTQAHFTVACAMIGRHLRDQTHYLEARQAVVALVQQVAEEAGFSGASVAVNAADDPARGSVYLTVTGTSAESGDDGQAGRGNRANGLITPFRPMTIESVAGKNPVTHVGKIYNIAAGLIAERIAAELPEVAEVECYLVSRIGAPIERPETVSILLRPQRNRSIEKLRPKIGAIVAEELDRLRAMPMAIVDDVIGIDRWPLRQRAPHPPDSVLSAQHRALLDEIVADMREIASATGRARLSERTLTAMAKVPREAFVPNYEEQYAYENRPLPIGFGQTISQPLIVALMTDLLDLKGGETVLEIGTGSGYQAAILSTLARRVYSIEVIQALADEARKRLRRLGYGNVEVRAGDGAKGWPEAAPFDAIIVTAAAPEIPPALLQQLKPGGRLIVPVGLPHRGQVLTLVSKDAGGYVRERPVLPVAFVPLIPEP
ncbi:MAG: protein-L-isoaspartate(D-aspartate) O-methyltransferase [Alphaproteobacteria bacterium]